MEATTSDEDGRFRFALQPPGKYRLEATKSGFATLNLADISISVTETLRLELRLRVATVVENLEVSAEIPMIETDNPALGRVVSETGVTSLPLATRNFAQIAGLSPGVVTGVFNAGELGLGGMAMSQINQSNDGIYVHGARSYDNNFQLDGISVSDVQGSSNASGGYSDPQPRCHPGVQSTNWILRCGLWTLWGSQRQRHHEERQQCLSRECLRILSERCVERESFLREPDWAKEACSQAKSVWLRPWGANQERQAPVLRFLSGHTTDKRSCCWPSQNSLHRQFEHAGTDRRSVAGCIGQVIRRQERCAWRHCNRARWEKHKSGSSGTLESETAGWFLPFSYSRNS